MNDDSQGRWGWRADIGRAMRLTASCRNARSRSASKSEGGGMRRGGRSGRGGRNNRPMRGESAKGRARRGMLDGVDIGRGRKRCVRHRLVQGSAASTAKARDPIPTRASDPPDAEMRAGQRGERWDGDVREVDRLPDRASPPAPGPGRGPRRGRGMILVRARDPSRGRDHALYRTRVRAQSRLDRTAVVVVVARTRALFLAQLPPAAAVAA